MTPYQIIFCTSPNQKTSEIIAHSLVEQKLAACVNILPGLTSIYCWQDQIEHASEQLLMIKTNSIHYAQIEQVIKTLHPYEIPEIIALAIDQGLPAYLDWIHQNTCFDDQHTKQRLV